MKAKFRSKELFLKNNEVVKYRFKKNVNPSTHKKVPYRIIHKLLIIYNHNHNLTDSERSSW